MKHGKQSDLWPGQQRHGQLGAEEQNFMGDIQPRPWSNVVQYYQNLVPDHGWNIEPMIQLVKQIEASGFAAGLFPYTSMFTLCIAHRHTPRMHQEELRITFSPAENRFHFEYWSQPLVKPGPWKRTCGAEDGFATLERILLKRVRWFKRIDNMEQPGEPPLPDQP